MLLVFLKNTYQGLQISMSFKNCVTYNECNHNIYMLFKKSNNLSYKFDDI